MKLLTIILSLTFTIVTPVVLASDATCQAQSTPGIAFSELPENTQYLIRDLTAPPEPQDRYGCYSTPMYYLMTKGYTYDGSQDQEPSKRCYSHMRDKEGPNYGTWKLDRNALPAPDQGSTQTYTPPRTETEERLVAIWEDLLGLDQVGVMDDFFGLGGHSLLATQLVSRIRDQLNVTLPLNSLFDDPTVAGLASAVDTLLWALEDSADDEADDDLEELEI